jgi:3-oxoacyl-[acyl-carrier protein] reductase
MGVNAMMSSDLTGRVALVTGASRGIGRAIALGLAESGCDVALNCIRSVEGMERVAADVVALGRKAVAVRADVSDASEVKNLIKQVEESLGPVDILVNNAGINPVRAIEDLSLEEWNQVLAANLTSSFLVSQAVIPGMRARGWGRLIMLSSVAAQTGGVIGPHYAASKAGQIGLAHSYANLLAKDGITANSIAPALIDTDMIRSNPAIKPSLVPIGRFGLAGEVAEAAVMLARNGYITGQTINLNGGWYMS